MGVREGYSGSVDVLLSRGMFRRLAAALSLAQRGKLRTNAQQLHGCCKALITGDLQQLQEALGATAAQYACSPVELTRAEHEERLVASMRQATDGSNLPRSVRQLVSTRRVTGP